ncbi:hypothetical protein BGZ65_005001 [Modicella reniformis]|uniref:HTH psq-type domain-containing protein n=1 Tax=Modicella reniformis TaxID=1440133 RepID=A0A9P6LSB8_9FUNG|nr:hypothetical protein BGZ65_005001 [Modicella reniformis]
MTQLQYRMQTLQQQQQQQQLQHAQWTVDHQPQPTLISYQKPILADNGQQQLTRPLQSESLHSLENQDLWPQEQEIRDLLFTPGLSPCEFSEKNSSSSIQIECNNVQNVQDHSSSNTQSLVPATYKRRKEEEYEIEDEANSKAKVKRPRKALQLQKRLEIISFCEVNQKMPVTKISKKFNVPRSTIYGIINNKDILNKLAKSQPSAGLNLERYRKDGSRFRILEELLVTWSLISRQHSYQQKAYVPSFCDPQDAF